VPPLRAVLARLPAVPFVASSLSWSPPSSSARLLDGVVAIETMSSAAWSRYARSAAVAAALSRATSSSRVVIVRSTARSSACSRAWRHSTIARFSVSST
jgi:hypothetical protein